MNVTPDLDTRFRAAALAQGLVDVRYEIRATNNVHNLVFPFYLTGS